METHRSLVFMVKWQNTQLDWLLTEFRLLVNESIRIALREDIRSRARLTRTAYQDLSHRHVVYKPYITSAFEVALGLLKAHRRRLKRRKKSSVPYMRKVMLKAENQSYRFDRETGRLRIPIRGTEGVQLQLALSEWHRSFLSDAAWGLGSLTVIPGKIVLVVRREAPQTFLPEAAIALDTNEDSMDGVVASGNYMTGASLPFGGVRRIQGTRFWRRRRLARNKRHDRRVMKRLLGQEGRRERNRVRQRTPSIFETTRWVRTRSPGRDCPRGPDASRCRRTVPSDESSTIVLAPQRDSSSDRVQGRPRGGTDHQGQSCMD